MTAIFAATDLTSSAAEIVARGLVEADRPPGQGRSGGMRASFDACGEVAVVSGLGELRNRVVLTQPTVSTDS